MDPVAQGSFIPKQSLAAAGRGGGMGLFFLVALLIFVMSILAAGASFAYEQLLNKRIADKDDQLRLAEGAFNPGTIQDLVRMDQRLGQAQTLLGKHVAPSALFYFLSTITLERVQLTALDYSLQQDGTADITLSGSADSFSTVALQSDQFGSSKVLRDVIFSGINVTESGRVNFSVNASADGALISYSKNLQQSAPSAAPAQ
jgi:hypothetical protein